MTPRSLPGMTMGARKRAARAIAIAEALRDDPDMPFWAWNLTERTVEAEPRDRREALRYFHENERTHDEAVTYRIVRARYRIGERLRPCLGCCACDAPPDDHPPEVACRPHCDGTGVLPDKSSERRKQPGLPISLEEADLEANDENHRQG